MISAWDIYWVMQMDDIAALLMTAGLISAGTAILLGILGANCASANPDEWTIPEYRAEEQRKLDRAPSLLKNAKRFAAVAMLSLTLGTLMPSTKTVAMMLVIPAVANNATVQKEAGELYGIAKDALRELAKPSVKQATEEPE